MANHNPGCLAAFLRLFGSNKEISVQHFPPDEPEALPYHARADFLSGAEASFYHLLKNTLSGQMVICPKVSLSDIFFVSRPDVNVAYYNKINRKHVDFLLCDPHTMKPVMAFELDDSSHGRDDRISRDAFVERVFSTAGLPLVRVPARLAYDTRDIQAAIRTALQAPPEPADQDISTLPADWSSSGEIPTCPKCGSAMVLRTARRGDRAGQQFYGCVNYPKCRGIREA